MFLDSNICGFKYFRLSKDQNIEHLIYTSSNSVYGLNSSPFSELDAVDHPISLYAATKESNELMAHAYSFYNMNTTDSDFYSLWSWGR